MDKLKLQKRRIGMVGTNVYLLIHTDSKEAILVDPADDAAGIIRWITEEQVTPVGMLLTHGHYDHIGAAQSVADHYNIPVYAGKDEKDMLETPALNMSNRFGAGYAVKATRLLAGGEVFMLAGFEIRAIHTPGHTPGGMCFYIGAEKVLLSGDTLFCETIGRTDLLNGSLSDLVHSVKELIETLPEDTAVYPGHEGETSIGHEKKYNPYYRRA